MSELPAWLAEARSIALRQAHGGPPQLTRPAWERQPEAQPGWQYPTPAQALNDPRTAPMDRRPTRAQRQQRNDIAQFSAMHEAQRNEVNTPPGTYFGQDVLETTGAPALSRSFDAIAVGDPARALPEAAMGSLGILSLGLGARAPVRGSVRPPMRAAAPSAPARAPTGSGGASNHGDLFPDSAPGPVQVYHGTLGEFAPEEIRPWSHFGTENAARQRLQGLVDPEFRDQAPMRVLPYEITGRRIDVGDEFVTPEMETSPTEISDMLLRGRHITPEEHAWATEPRRAGSRFEGRDADEVVLERLSDLAERYDIGAIGYRNALEDAGSRSYIVPNPRNVRSNGDSPRSRPQRRPQQ